jgi:hypothetical protein
MISRHRDTGAPEPLQATKVNTRPRESLETNNKRVHSSNNNNSRKSSDALALLVLR